MNPIFFKQLPLVLQIQGKPEWANFAAGFSKAVDPQSGMTVNLKQILIWLEDLKTHFSQKNLNSWSELLSLAFQFLSTKAQAEKAAVEVVQIQFIDQSELRYQNQDFLFSSRNQSVDSLGRLRILTVHFSGLSSDSELDRLRKMTISNPFPGSFDEEDLMFGYFESQLGIRPSRIELRDPLSDVTTIFP